MITRPAGTGAGTLGRELLAAGADPAVEHDAGQLDVDVALAAQPTPVGQEPRERRHGQVLGPVDRVAEHHEHPHHGQPARDDVRREVRVGAHVSILPQDADTEPWEPR